MFLQKSVDKIVSLGKHAKLLSIISTIYRQLKNRVIIFSETVNDESLPVF